MGHRVISGLLHAARCQRPRQFPAKPTAKGAKGQGLRYERALARAMPYAQHGQWFEFRDRAGLGHCQPDLLIDRAKYVIVLEVKYTWTAEGHSQIDQLYRPVVERALGKPVIGIVVCKMLTPAVTFPVVSLLEDALAIGGNVVLHWPVFGGIGPGALSRTKPDSHAMHIDTGGLVPYGLTVSDLGL